MPNMPNMPNLPNWFNPRRASKWIVLAALTLTVAGVRRVCAEADFKFPALGGPEASAETQAGFAQLYQGNLDESLRLFNAATENGNSQDTGGDWKSVFVDGRPMRRNSRTGQFMQAGAQKTGSATAQLAPAYYGLAIHALGNSELQHAVELLCQAASAGRNTAWEELYLERLARVLPYCSDPKPFETFTQETLSDASASPYAKDLVRRKYGEWLEGRGKIDEARAVNKPLNYITQWSLCGPFDNRDNSGFATAYDPEKEVDFEKLVQGRNRKVNWFRPGADPFDGRIDLTDLFEPHIHVIAYGVTFVKADADGWVVVRGSAAGALAVWVNNKPAGTIADHNEWGADKLAAPVYLRKGWNKVLVKSAVVEDTAWAFALRFCALEGGAAPGLKVDASAAALAEYNAVKPAADAPPEKPEYEAGLFDRLARCVASAPDNVPALSAYTYLYELGSRGKKDDRGAPRQLTHAVSLAPKCPCLRLQVAATSNDNNEARQAAEEALALNPQVPATLEMLANLAEESHLHVIAEDYARQACAKLGDKNCSLSLLTLADALIERSDGGGRGHRADVSDRRAEAWRLVRKFTAQHPYCGEGWRRLAQLEVSGSARRVVLEIALANCGGDEQLRQMYSEELGAIGQERQAAEFLAKTELAHPYSVPDVLAASAQFRRAGDIAQAGKLLTDARAWAPENPELLSALALADHYEGKNSDALQLYQAALQLKPNSPKIKDYLAELNEGKSTDKQFFAPYDIALKSLELPKSEAYPNDNTVNVLEQEVIRLNPNFSASRMVHVIAKVLRPAGVQELARHQIYYDPERQVVDILRAAVITPDGRELSRADVRDLSTSAAAGVETRIYDEHHLKQVHFRDLETGSIIDLQYTIRDSGENIYGDYFADTHYLSDDKPTVRNQYILDYPKSLHIQSRTFKADIQPEHLESKDTQRETMKWEYNNTPGRIHEAGMPPMVDELGQVQITTMGSWEDVGKWYWHLASEQLVVSDELKKEIAEITKNCKTDEDKVRAVQQFVIHQIRYLGIEFGRNGYKPHAASESYKARYGDCKDKATLITAMLKELGIDSRLVLIRTINAGAVPQDSLPMPNLFNHCIAYVPNVGGKDFWIDGTADFHRLGDIPAMDRSAQVLVVEPNSGKFVKIPLNTPEDNLIEQRFNVTVAADGAAAVSLRDNRHGQWAPRYRELSEMPGLYERDMKNYAAKRLNGATLLNWKASKSGEEGPVWLEAEFNMPALASQSGDRRALPAAFEPLMLSQRYTGENKRNYDLEMYFPWRRHTEINYTLTDPLKAATLPEEASLDEPFGKYSRKMTKDARGVHIVEEFEFSTHRVLVADYDAFKAFCNKVDALMEEKVLIDGK